MNRSVHIPADPQLDLVFERVVDVPRELVWNAWTQPGLLKQWFTPAPWQTVDCELDPRPGGIFRTVMRSPEGQDMPNTGCYLEVVQNERLSWTNLLGPGYRPMILSSDESCDSFGVTGILTLSAHDGGTRYTARVLHADEAGRRQHEAMGFQEGWGKALDQLVALVKAG